ncbi:peptidase C39 family protein [Streptomyces sp. NPDC059176]|uniref:peptidase C39 family protein n=1 Tax=unclassified Streptomyces TaxID=2593676 RepID=UPI0036A1E22F
MPRPASRRTLLTAALAAAAGGSTLSPAVPAAAAPGAAAARPLVDNHFWTSYADWLSGGHTGTRAVLGSRPGIVIATPLGRTNYTDPYTGKVTSWEYAMWTSPVHRPRVPATEAVASWNAHTPPGTWLRIQLSGTYSDGTSSPWFVMGRWAAGDGDIRRNSIDRQTDGKATVRTDTLALRAPASGLRLTSYRLRLTLYRKPGTALSPTVWRTGAMVSDVPDRFSVPASAPAFAGELAVPRYSQNVHTGQYPEYDNGGEAWCSPTSSQMTVEFWGRRPTARDLAWVNPSFSDPQVCHAARHTYDYQYKGCGNWPFNAAYAATYRDMNAVVTRLESLGQLESLVRAGIPVITSQSFRKEELTGAGYGTSGHLMTVIGFTRAGDVIANDPASPSNAAVRRVYRRAQWETIWLRTKRYDARGRVASGTGGVCYVYWPESPTAAQRKALAALGIR